MTFLPPVSVTVPKPKIVPPNNFHDIKITSPAGPSSTQVEIDGKPELSATAIRFEITADNWAVAELRIIPSAFSYEGQAVLKISDDTAEMLVKLGWTPPANG